MCIWSIGKVNDFKQQDERNLLLANDSESFDEIYNNNQQTKSN